MKASRHTPVLAAALLTALIGFTVQADEVDPASITTFTAGTPAVAEEVNGNFSALIAAINDNAQRIEALGGGDTPVVGGSSYTVVTFEAGLLASNCNPGDYTVDEETGNTTYGPSYCTELNMRRLNLLSGLLTFNFLSDGTGFGSEVFDQAALSTPERSGALSNAVESIDEAVSSTFTFTWTQTGNVVTIQDDEPGEAPFEAMVTPDGSVAVIRFVARSSVGDPEWPVDQGLVVGSLATQYYQAIAIAVRN